jgi:hypothetical protein
MIFECREQAIIQIGTEVEKASVILTDDQKDALFLAFGILSEEQRAGIKMRRIMLGKTNRMHEHRRRALIKLRAYFKKRPDSLPAYQLENEHVIPERRMAPIPPPPGHRWTSIKFVSDKKTQSTKPRTQSAHHLIEDLGEFVQTGYDLYRAPDGTCWETIEVMEASKKAASLKTEGYIRVGTGHWELADSFVKHVVYFHKHITDPRFMWIGTNRP